jgi:two-component sensor histidine kinase
VAFALPGRWHESIVRIRAYSVAAVAVAIACLGAATLLRIVVGWFGANAPFSTYFPAVLIAALVAGAPAAMAVIVGSVIIAWWTFLPPAFEFNRLGVTEDANIAMFVLSSGLIVIVAHLYRRTLVQLRSQHSERELLMRELQHRGRNTYAIVETIVRNTLSPDRAKADIIAARVRAVSSANDLVNWSSTRTVALRKLLSLVCGGNSERIFASGPDIELSAGATRTLGLVFHELLTNAMKYGALSNPDGTVAIHWTLETGKVRLVWVEKGGPIVSQPDRTGFGTTVITQSLTALAGGIIFAFDPAGLRCDIEFNPQS